MSHVSPAFQALGLPPRALAAVARMGWSTPSPVQERAIPPALAGRDVIGCAATGTGKTGAFVLPLLERLQPGGGSQALILAPTRELALQIDEQLRALAHGSSLRSAVIIGGLGMNPQAQALREGREVIVATPGRLNDHLDSGVAKLSRISALVLDEADRMLDMGFKPQLERILRKLPVKKQTLLFSATMAGEVAEFARKHLRDPARVEVTPSGTVAARAGQRVFEIRQEEKPALLMALLAADEKTTLVFTRTKHRADRLHRTLERAGHSVARIHADRSQSQRRHALDGFRTGAHRILVATDIAARGIDVEDIGHVVNFDLPQVPEDYVHRIGRTARAGASGIASTFCTPEDRSMLREIERFTRNPIPRAEVPRESEAFRAEVSRQKHPGPRQPGHGVSARTPGTPAGRHARTHRRRGLTPPAAS